MSEIKQIVVGVDGSEGSTRALAWAMDEAEHHGATLRAVLAWSPMMPGLGPGYSVARGPGFDEQEFAEQRLKEILGGANSDAEPVVVQGRAAKVLIDNSADADLLVVGNRGHGGFAGMMLGSVSQHVSAHSDCPVVVIR